MVETMPQNVPQTTSGAMMAKPCDCLIIGAGAVGGLLACLLARRGWSVVLAEQGAVQTDPGLIRDTRGYALSAGSVQILADTGYWSELVPHSEPIENIHVSRQGAWGSVELDAASLGVDHLGYVVPASQINALVARSLPDAVDVLPHTRFFSLQAESDGRRAVTLQGPAGLQRFLPRLVIAADGAQSPTRAAADIAVAGHRYAADALVFDVAPERYARGWAFERFTDQGPLALLPQAQGRMNVVWIAPPDICAQRLALTETERSAELQRYFGWRLGRLHAAGPVGRFPLELVQAQGLFADRVVLVGNAAHGLHPVAGQGLNLSLRDVAQLTAVLSVGSDPGQPDVLQRYAGLRAPDIRTTIQVTDWLARGMLLDQPMLTPVLATGLRLLDRVFPLRNAFARRAMGLLPMPRHTLRRLARAELKTESGAPATDPQERRS